MALLPSLGVSKGLDRIVDTLEVGRKDHQSSQHGLVVLFPSSGGGATPGERVDVHVCLPA